MISAIRYIVPRPTEQKAGIVCKVGLRGVSIFKELSVQNMEASHHLRRLLDEF